MRSSISSSDIRVLHADWLRTWALALFAVALFFGGWEVFWRVRGFQPSLTDDARLWAAARRRVEPRSTVLIGASRMHADVQPSVFREVTGATPIQLAVSGGMIYPVLENLARDETFRGTVVCDLMEFEIATGLTTELEKSYVRASEQETLAGRSESLLRRGLQSRFALASEQLALPMVARSVQRGVLPAPVNTRTILADRTLAINFSRVNITALRTEVASLSVYQGPSISTDEFISRAHRFEILAERIERRGGRVIFVKFPISGVLWERLESVYPKAYYWDEFARRTSFQTIHFKDYTDLQIECPDYSHLDGTVAPRFTRALAWIVSRSR